MKTDTENLFFDIMAAMSENVSKRNYNRRLFALCGLAGLMYGIDVGLIAAALPYIKATCSFTEAQLSGIVAAVLLGCVPGTFFASLTAERFGRLAAFRVTAAVFAVAVPLICFSDGNFCLMFSGRILQGVGCAFVGIAAPLYMAECAGAGERGRGMGMMQLVLTVGLVLAALVGMAVVGILGPAEDPDVPLAAKNLAWRSIFYFSAAPAALLYAGTFFLRESPRWLFSRGRIEEARLSLLANSEPAAADAVLAQLRDNAESERSCGGDGAGSPFATFMRRRYAVPFALAFAVACFNQGTGINSLLNYSVVMFQKAGLSGAAANVADIAVKTANLAMTVVALFFVDRRGRRFLLSVGTLGAAAGLVFAGAFFFAVERGLLAAGATAGIAVAAGVVLYVGSFAVGPGVCAWLALSELMPLRIRARGMMLAGFGSMFVSYLIAQAFLPWSRAFGESSVFFTLSGIAALYFLTVRLALPETKGRSLEEIERSFAEGEKENGE